MKPLSRTVACKLEDGDFRGSIRLASSGDHLVPFNPATFTFDALQEKHLAPHPDSTISPPPSS